MTAVRLITALILMALLGGCASYRTIWLYGGYIGDAQTSAFRFSGANRDFRTSVIGNPFDVPMAETERAVIAAMKGEDKGMDSNFTTTPRNAYKNNHIIMLLNPPGRHGGRGGCDVSRSHSGKSASGDLVLAALFCDGDRLVYGVAASRAALNSPQDPAFRQFVKEIMDFFVPQHSMTGGTRDDDDNDNDND